MSHTPPSAFKKLVSAILALGCCGCLGIVLARADAPDGCYPVPAMVAPNYSQPLNLDFIKKQLPLLPL